MALLFMDSGDHWVQSTQFVDQYKKWSVDVSNLSGSVLNQAAFVLYGYGADQPGGGNYFYQTQNGGSQNWRMFKQLPSTYQTTIIGGWFYCPDQGVSSQALGFGVADDLTEQVNVAFLDTMRLQVQRGGGGGTALGTTTKVLSPFTWNFIELKTKIDPSTGTVELRVNGETWLSLTGQNTRATANSTVNRFMLGGYANSVQLIYGDMYMLDTSGSVANDFLGPCRVSAVHPMGNGSYSQWIPEGGTNYSTVSEKFADADITYNGGAMANSIDSFVFQDAPCTNGTIHGIQHILYAKQDQGTTRTIAPYTNISGTAYLGSTLQVPGSYLFLTDPATLNPATSAQWTTAAFNAAEFGYKLVS